MSTMKFPLDTRNLIVSEARALFHNWSSKPHTLIEYNADHIHQQCLWFAYFTALAIGNRGGRPVIQAGSAYWPIIPREMAELDYPGVHRFGYEFTPGAHNALILRSRGYLPEIHCWVGLPNSGELIDVTTCYWKRCCAELFPDEKWLAPDPPDYFWQINTRPFPWGVDYRPDRQAIYFVHQIIDAVRPDLDQR